MTKKSEHCKFKGYALELTKKILVCALELKVWSLAILSVCYSYVNDKQEKMTEEMTSLHDKIPYEVGLFFQFAIYRVMLQW